MQALDEIETYLKEHRVSMGHFINSPAPEDPDARLLRAAACCMVFSAVEEHFQ